MSKFNYLEVVQAGTYLQEVGSCVDCNARVLLLGARHHSCFQGRSFCLWKMCSDWIQTQASGFVTSVWSLCLRGLSETTGDALVGCGWSCSHGSAAQSWSEFSWAVYKESRVLVSVWSWGLQRMVRMLEGCSGVLRKAHRLACGVLWLINVCTHRQPQVRRCCPSQPYLPTI